MEYNTSKEKLTIPEYGRNIQTLIHYAKTLEDREYRQAFVEEIVKLMQNMHPQARNVEDYIAKLWSHVYKISGYDLDVDFPENVNLEPLENKRPKMIPYPDGAVKFRHYGRNVQEMIKKAAKMEDEEKRGEFLQIIAAYMKMAYKTWNQPVVSDESIIRDLKLLVGNSIDIDETLSLDNNFAYRKRHRADDRDSRERGGDRDMRDSRERGGDRDMRDSRERGGDRDMRDSRERGGDRDMRDRGGDRRKSLNSSAPKRGEGGGLDNYRKNDRRPNSGAKAPIQNNQRKRK